MYAGELIRQLAEVPASLTTAVLGWASLTGIMGRIRDLQNGQRDVLERLTAFPIFGGGLSEIDPFSDVSHARPSREAPVGGQVVDAADSGAAPVGPI